MITLSPTAIDRAKAIAAEDGLSPRLRIRILGGGCAGFQYDMYFDEVEPTPLDDVTEQDGITVVVDPLSLQYIDGCNVDFLKTDFAEGFKFNNPNTTATCGCGSSFKT